jgi:adenylate cyclase
MAEEIELKLALPMTAHRLFLRHPLLRQAARKQTWRLTNLYQDTPALELRQRGIAMRLRAKGRFWLQTVKCAGDRAGGLSARPEWETPYGGQLDFSAIDDPAVRDWLTRPKIAGRLAPLFETNFQRSAWTFERPRGTRIELALDRGCIIAGGQREAISEVEIELLAGDPADLFALARELAERVPLFPAPLSKADRGYRLFNRQPVAPVRAPTIPLSADDTPVAALRAIALACLDHLQRNREGAVAGEDPEYIHQMRIAVRRLRAALHLFGPLLPEGFAAPLLSLLREPMARLGAARDHDVLLDEIIVPVRDALPDEPRIAALAERIVARRNRVRDSARDDLGSVKHGQFLLDLLAMLHGLDPKFCIRGTAVDLAEFARERLRSQRRQVRRRAARARHDAPETLHALRIGVKRLRYALEFFAPLAAKKPMRRLLSRLTALQDTLGQINDLANAGAVLMDCAGDQPRLREAVMLIGGWHGPRYRKLLAAVPRDIKRLGKLPLPQLATRKEMR